MGKAILKGLVAGLLLAILAGGVTSAIYGKPFVGTKGLDAFYSGLVFPGLIAFAPPGAIVGAVPGGIVAAVTNLWRGHHHGKHE